MLHNAHPTIKVLFCNSRDWINHLLISILTIILQSIIYYTIRSAKLDEWLNSSVIREALKGNADKNFVDLDPLFNMNIDEDFDFR